jgi:hypothetical protein
MDAQKLAKTLPEQKIEFLPFSSLVSLLQLEEPPLMRDDFRQLNYIERYLRQAKPPCLSVVIERYYIDRDFIQDFGVFYSTSLYAYPNWCQRIHFFSIDKNQVRRELRKLVELGANAGIADSGGTFEKACRDFSDKFYMGFSVIKPLLGSPVGRTVLRHYGVEAGKGLVRKFNCTRNYQVHLLGIDLTVCGLIFQQQDVGVSACATTAVWSSLSKTRDFEEIATPTPAQITQLASQYVLPFGRPMPSEGLSIEQMCQAIQAVHVSPTLIIIENANDARGFLHSAILSGFAPVLVLESVRDKYSYHAVTVAGMKVRKKHSPTILRDRIDDEAGDLVSLYVHDDRLSPYFRADLLKRKSDLILRLNLLDDAGNIEGSDPWKLRHILIPIHGKIRLSFAPLREMTIDLIKMMRSYGELYSKKEGKVDLGIIQFRTLILRAPIYVQHLFYGQQKLAAAGRAKFDKKVLLSRYVGVARLSSDVFGILDILFDTTSTLKNPHCLGIVARIKDAVFPLKLAGFLSQELKCPLIVDIR